MNPELVAGAVRYAKADKSDPFALRRALSHVREGLCEPFYDEAAKKLRPGGYDAKPQKVVKSYVHPVTKAVRKYDAVEYVDAKRP